MLFQKKRKKQEESLPDFHQKLEAIVEEYCDSIRKSQDELSKNLDLCILGIQSIQRMQGIKQEEG